MPYDTENVLDSGRAYEILEAVVLEEDESYGTEIAEELGIRQQLVSEILNRLTRLSILRKGERGRAQRYHLDPVGAVERFWELWEGPFDDVERETRKKIEAEAGEGATNPRGEEAVGRFIVSYMIFYLSLVEESTIEKMLTEDFFDGLQSYCEVYDNEGEMPGWLRDLCREFSLLQGRERVTPQRIVSLAAEEVETDVAISEGSELLGGEEAGSDTGESIYREAEKAISRALEGQEKD